MQDELVESIVTRVEHMLATQWVMEQGCMVVGIPYGLWDENKIIVAEWLVANFPRRVTCIDHGRFVTLSTEYLVAANTYWVDLRN